jgi:hypothetical protein
MDVAGWLSAKARTGRGMVRVATNAALMNGSGRVSMLRGQSVAPPAFNRRPRMGRVGGEIRLDVGR